MSSESVGAAYVLAGSARCADAASTPAILSTEITFSALLPVVRALRDLPTILIGAGWVLTRTALNRVAPTAPTRLRTLVVVAFVRVLRAVGRLRT